MWTSKIRKVPFSILGVSEPNPMYFGNAANEIGNGKWTNSNWLKSRFHFAFAEYVNPANTNFGVLRVMNDDLVQPNRGFGTHGHRDAEIMTYVVEGDLTHQDSMGTKETLSRGAVQFMTAGKGVHHSEHNLNTEKPLRFIQMWLTPYARGLQPNYGSFITADAADRRNKWQHLAAGVTDMSAVDAKIKINCDANLYVTEIVGKDASIKFDLKQGRQAYLLIIEGDNVTATTTSSPSSPSLSFQRHDAAELYGPLSMSFANDNSDGFSHLLLVEMENDGRGGRGDLKS